MTASAVFFVIAIANLIIAIGCGIFLYRVIKGVPDSWSASGRDLAYVVSLLLGVIFASLSVMSGILSFIASGAAG